uniref:Uncharacterized protein n=1 Tax=viral metagenome TaxID=1070528 RepID=A0A6C0HSZ6_9ZZZZ
MWKLFLLLFNSPRKLYEKMVLLKQLEYSGIQSYYKLEILEEKKHLFSSNESLLLEKMISNDSLFLDWNFNIE